MQVIFDIKNLNLPDGSKPSIEENIKDILLGIHSPFSPCHQGDGKVTLARSDTDATAFVGNIKCNCGKALGTIRGLIDCSEIKFNPA